MSPTSYQAAPPRDKDLRSGGDDRVRTGDLLLAKQALSQLSYAPEKLVYRFRFTVPSGNGNRKLETEVYGGPGLIRTADLVLIRDAL
jgi:hypothetical protein